MISIRFIVGKNIVYFPSLTCVESHVQTWARAVSFLDFEIVFGNLSFKNCFEMRFQISQYEFFSFKERALDVTTKLQYMHNRQVESLKKYGFLVVMHISHKSPFVSIA